MASFYYNSVLHRKIHFLFTVFFKFCNPRSLITMALINIRKQKTSVSGEFHRNSQTKRKHVVLAVVKEACLETYVLLELPLITHIRREIYRNYNKK